MHTSAAQPTDLVLDTVSVAYGHVRAAEDVSLTARPGETLVLLGPNGAGKSTLLRAVSGQAPKTSGRVRIGDVDISSWPAHRIARAGVAHVPEGRHMVGPLTVHENLELAARSSRRLGRGEVRAVVGRSYDLFPPLARLRDRPSALLSGGEQQMVAIGRALAIRPRVLLLDEPSMGLAPVMVETIYGFLADHGGVLDDVTVVLAEQNRAAVRLADRAVVLAGGHVVHAGGADTLTDALLTRAYLGDAGSEPTANPSPPIEGVLP